MIKQLIFICFFLLIVLGFNPVFSENNNCVAKSHKILEMGLKIQNAIKNKSLPELQIMMNKKSDGIPRFKDIEQKKFDDIFPANWQQKVLSKNPPCNPLGWRGYQLGAGSLWFDEEGVFSLNNINTFEPPRTKGAWIYKNQRISTSCLEMVWITKDNYELLYEEFLANKGYSFKEFESNPGRFVGSELPLHFIEGYVAGNNINISKELSSCFSENKITEKSWLQRQIECEDCEGVYEYQIMGKAPLSLCEKYVEYKNLQCLDAKLIHVRSQYLGTIGKASGYNFYALVEAKNSNKYVIPLENFTTKNQAWDRLEDVRLNNEEN